MNIQDKIIKIASELSGMPSNQITLKSTLKEELSLDSLSLVELVVACEDEFQIEIDMDHPDTAKAETLEDLHNAILMLTSSN
jgi:acyl carrier protein